MSNIDSQHKVCPKFRKHDCHPSAMAPKIKFDTCERLSLEECFFTHNIRTKYKKLSEVDLNITTIKYSVIL